MPLPPPVTEALRKKASQPGRRQEKGRSLRQSVEPPNPKPQIRNPKQTAKGENAKGGDGRLLAAPSFPFPVVVVRCFFSCFGFRVSDFGFSQIRPLRLRWVGTGRRAVGW